MKFVLMKKQSFEQHVKRDKSVTTHLRNLQFLTTKIFKFKIGSASALKTESFNDGKLLIRIKIWLYKTSIQKLQTLILH